MRWVVLVFVASCYSPAPYASCGVTCVTDIECPTGQSCFDNRCSAQAGQCMKPDDIDAAIDAAPDSDGDTVPDAIDKCPTVMSKDNRDHDNDGLGDVCDPCPMFTDNTNSDTDKIGDKCDPRPSNGNDVAMFFGFYDANEYTAWGRGGTWSFVDGKLIGTNLMAGGQIFFDTPMTFGGNVAAYASIEFLKLNPDVAFDRHAGVSVRRAGVAFEGCQFGASQSLGPYLRVRKVPGIDVSTTYNGTLTAGSHPVELVALDGNNTCTVDAQAIGGNGVREDGKVGIDNALSNIAVDYLFVVTMN